MTAKKRINRKGYWHIRLPSNIMSTKQGYVAEHRLVMSEHIGRPLEAQEAVHHIDGNKRNNNINNLELFSSNGQHTKNRHPEVMEKLAKSGIGKRPPNYNQGTFICPICSSSYQTVKSNSARHRKTCSMLCSRKLRSGFKPTEKQIEALKKGHGWNKGKPATWVKKGKESQNWKHGRYSKYSNDK